MQGIGRVSAEVYGAEVLVSVICERESEADKGYMEISLLSSDSSSLGKEISKRMGSQGNLGQQENIHD